MSGMAGMALAWGAEGGESQGGTDRTTCENARQKARPFTITIAWFSVFQPPFPLFYCSSLSLSFYPLLLLAPIFLPRLSPPSIARASLADGEEGYFTGIGKVSSATGFFHVTTRQGCHGKRNKRSLAALDV